MRFAPLMPGELDAVALGDDSLVVCGFDTEDVPPLSPQQFDALIRERQRLGRILHVEDVLRIVEAKDRHNADR